MADWETEMEQRHAARVALMQRCLESPGGGYVRDVARWQEEGRDGFPAAPQRPAAARPPTEREQLLHDGLIFTVAEQDRRAAALEHRERRRRADEATASSERLFKGLRNLYGADGAEAWMRGQ